LANYNDAIEQTGSAINDTNKKLEHCAQSRRRRLLEKHCRLIEHRDELEQDALDLYDALEGDA
jgi:hypothetical protein